MRPPAYTWLLGGLLLFGGCSLVIGDLALPAAPDMADLGVDLPLVLSGDPDQGGAHAADQRPPDGGAAADLGADGGNTD